MGREKPERELETKYFETKVNFAQNDRKYKSRGFKTKVSAMLVHPRPGMQLCRYEQIREEIVRERREAIAKGNFFEDLKTTKEKIGLYSKGTNKTVSKKEERRISNNMNVQTRESQKVESKKLVN